MGIDVHALNFLKYANKLQKMRCENFRAQDTWIQVQMRLFPLKYTYGSYCEPLLLDTFGASKVDSLIIQIMKMQPILQI